MKRWARGEKNSHVVVNNEATLERTGTRWAQGVRPSVEADLSDPGIPAAVEERAALWPQWTCHKASALLL